MTSEQPTTRPAPPPVARPLPALQRAAAELRVYLNAVRAQDATPRRQWEPSP